MQTSSQKYLLPGSLLLILCGSAPAVAWASPALVRFDIVCLVKGHSAIDDSRVQNEGPGRMGPSIWSYNLRYAIDLERKLYRNKNWVNGDALTIGMVTKQNIYFSKDRDSFERYGLHSGRYRTWARGGGFMDTIETGRCHEVGFSGLGAAALRRHKR